MQKTCAWEVNGHGRLWTKSGVWSRCHTCQPPAASMPAARRVIWLRSQACQQQQHLLGSSKQQQAAAAALLAPAALLARLLRGGVWRLELCIHLPVDQINRAARQLQGDRGRGAGAMGSYGACHDVQPCRLRVDGLPPAQRAPRGAQQLCTGMVEQQPPQEAGTTAPMSATTGVPSAKGSAVRSNSEERAWSSRLYRPHTASKGATVTSSCGRQAFRRATSAAMAGANESPAGPSKPSS